MVWRKTTDQRLSSHDWLPGGWDVRLPGVLGREFPSAMWGSQCPCYEKIKGTGRIIKNRFKIATKCWLHGLTMKNWGLTSPLHKRILFYGFFWGPHHWKHPPWSTANPQRNTAPAHSSTLYEDVAVVDHPHSQRKHHSGCYFWGQKFLTPKQPTLQGQPRFRYSMSNWAQCPNLRKNGQLGTTWPWETEVSQFCQGAIFRRRILRRQGLPKSKEASSAARADLSVPPKRDGNLWNMLKTTGAWPALAS